MKKILFSLLFLSCSREEIKQESFDFKKQSKYKNLGICTCNEGIKFHVSGKIISIDSLEKQNK